ncbi:unnamed protein product [Hermetia illucens]|uniref:Uncharacterized protein n=1 Tax=Hermetia illucens TaxID=343691 RepID=A0A7R8UKN4_HERIL|nr:unnamed protein product [Hermetia illucens]
MYRLQPRRGVISLGTSNIINFYLRLMRYLENHTFIKYIPFATLKRVNSPGGSERAPSQEPTTARVTK